ncbi:uncharacterized protein LOC121975235 [Zingiber officinale]|uniref:uncharacterized protein LOC121975235 n=1 Tax=Zingiber officinale TaxID=94328 RepID=UPI001C4B9B0D|nr:uncharacterized protein LOC121975235 [Zingiber officinale]
MIWMGGPGGVRWRNGRALGEGSRARHRGDAQALALAVVDAEEDILEPAFPMFEEIVDIRLEELTMEVVSLRTMMDTMVHRQSTMQTTLDTLVDLVSFWVTGHPSQSVPSTDLVPHVEDVPSAVSATTPAPATTSAPSADPDTTLSGDDLIEFYVPL